VAWHLEALEAAGVALAFSTLTLSWRCPDGRATWQK